MDPLTIATTATGIVKGCYQVTATVYTIIDDTRNVDTNVDDLLREIQGLSRSAESIGSAWSQNPMIVTAQAGQQRSLWGSVGTSLEDCQITLARLNSKLDELKKGSLFGRGFLRKPTKLVMLNMRLKEIVAFKHQIQSYNSAMQSALLMINVCLCLNNNSSQESVVQILGGLKNQIGHLRIETTRQEQLVADFASPELAQDNRRMTQNLFSLIQEAEALHSSASTVVGDSRSTIWGGSVLGNPLSDEQYSGIQKWISPPVIFEEEVETGPSQSSRSFLDSDIGEGNGLGQDSDADSDIDRDLMKRYGEVALTNFEQKDYVKAESFLQKVIEMSADVNVPDDDMRETSLMLAFSCGLQTNWEKAESILLPIAMTKSITDPRPFHGLQALALFHLSENSHETAIKYCKRAIGGFRKLKGRTSLEYYNSMTLLAQIFDAQGDHISAEGCRTFLPSSYNEKLVVDPQVYLSAALSAIRGKPQQAIQHQERSVIPLPGGSSSPSLTSTRNLTGSTSLTSLPPSSSSAPGIGAVMEATERLRINPTRPQPNPESGMHLSTRAIKPRLWVAVEFGVTETAVAFTYLRDRDPALSRPELITWPSGSASSTSMPRNRIPSVLYYDEKLDVVGWGPDIADALSPNGYPKPVVTKVEWVSTRLMLEFSRQTNLPPPPPGRSGFDAVVDFLFQVRQGVRSFLHNTIGEAFWEEEGCIHYCFTMLPIWMGTARDSLHSAIIRAGYLKNEGDNRLSFIDPGNAAVIYCLDRSLIKLQTGEVVLVVDCGGGTIDLIAYQLESPTTYTLNNFTASSGDYCGSSAVNRNFSKFVREKTGKMNFPGGNKSKTAERIWARCIIEFENRIKLDFKNNGQKWAIDVGVEVEFPSLGLEEGYMVFTNEEILACFDPVINRILELIRDQISAVQSENGFLKCVVVTGTFAKSDYLFEKIKRHYPPQLLSNIIRPDDTSTASVQGAVIAAQSKWPPP